MTQNQMDLLYIYYRLKMYFEHMFITMLSVLIQTDKVNLGKSVLINNHYKLPIFLK